MREKSPAAILGFELRKRGFRRLGSTALVARFEEVVHVAYTHRSKVDESQQIVIGAWRPGLSLGSLKFSEQIRYASIGGVLSPEGIGQEKWWRDHEGSLLRECIAGVALPFLASISNSDDLAECAREKYSTADRYAPVLAAIEASKGEPLDGVLPVADYPASAHGHARLTEAVFSSRALAWLSAVSAGFGFAPYKSDRQCAVVRDRGDFIDVIEARRAQYGLQGSFSCFVTSRAIWSARREFKGLLVQTNGGAVGSRGLSSGVCCFNLDDVFDGSRSSGVWELLRAQAFPVFESISTRTDFISAVGMGWDDDIVPALRRIWDSPDSSVGA